MPGQSVSRILSSARLRFTPEGVVPGPIALGRSSIWAGDFSSARAANPGLERNEPLLVPAWPCSWRRLPGRRHCCPRRWSLTPPFHHCHLRGCMFLWPDRQVSPPREFPRRHALWSADFPLFPATARLAWTVMIQCATFGVKCAEIAWVDPKTKLDSSRPIAI